MIKTIGLVTGGGDAPGLNAVIRAVVKTAVGEFGLRVVGIEDSFEGLIGETHVRELRPADVRGLLPRGGTILGTRNRGSFVLKNLEEDPDGESVFRGAIANLERLGVDALVASAARARSASRRSSRTAESPSSACPRRLTTTSPPPS